MTSPNTVLDAGAPQGQDDEHATTWQQDQARFHADYLRQELKRLDRFAAGEGTDTYERAASAIAGSAMSMLVEARADRPVVSHADPEWVRLGESVIDRAERLRAESRAEA